MSGNLTETIDADALRAQFATLAAENERLKRVAGAAEEILEILHWTPQLHPKIAALGVALGTWQRR